MGRKLGGRYRLVREIGSGGMSTVWRAVDLRLDRRVAVKLLLEDLAGSPRARQRMGTEARVVARLDHPNIATVFDVGTVRRGLRRSLPYLVMEYVDGETLDTRLRGTPVPWQRAAQIAAEVADALAAAHLHRVVHRDVKPGNIMLTASGVKLVDFGLAGVVGAFSTGSFGVLLGTPEYMAPEQLRGEPVTVACDMFAFGVVLYHLLTGTLPWSEATRPMLIGARRQWPEVTMPAIPGVPAGLVDLCDRCLSNEPDARPSSRRAARVLRALLAGAGASGEVPPPALSDLGGEPARYPRLVVADSPPAGRRTLRPGAVAAALGASLAVGAWVGPVSGDTPVHDASDCTVGYTTHRGDGRFSALLSAEPMLSTPSAAPGSSPAHTSRTRSGASTRAAS
ncbi:serine/threonine-protein kinase [Dactylosporangium sucinum]|uniref:non-specific serine/threonine protein kinase n=1 Tax=Dactylosporangium sucinum TaxID=1424081 RepID=A0A917TVJ6_9ACTN|nr:serine/threonine-protein kinase [Dactylosporangium sucinum]GGM37514.1 hypothetical protein GCM10007977_043680 [Dactylosporangium sucinum]